MAITLAVMFDHHIDCDILLSMLMITASAESLLVSMLIHESCNRPGTNNSMLTTRLWFRSKVIDGEGNILANLETQPN